MVNLALGFIRLFLVADRVVVTTKNNTDTVQVWESYSGNKYSITEGNSNDILRGTRIDLYIKNGSEKYLEESTLKNIIKTHSEFIDYPIKILSTKTKEIPIESDNEETTNDSSKEDKKVTPETRTETYTEWEILNNQKPIWTRPETELKLEDYNQFYKNMPGNYDDPMAYKHFSVEGSASIKGLLYIPKRSPFNMFQQTEKN